LRGTVLRGELLAGLTELAALGQTTLSTELTTTLGKTLRLTTELTALRQVLRLTHLAVLRSETLRSGEVLALRSEAVTLRQVALGSELTTLGHATLSKALTLRDVALREALGLALETTGETLSGGDHRRGGRDAEVAIRVDHWQAKLHA